MTPGDETIQAMHKVAREEAEKAAEEQAELAGKEERVRREQASTRMGWGMLGIALLIVGANIAADLMQGQRPEFSAAVVTLVVLMGFGGGALVQGVRLDRILTAWRNGKSNGSEGAP